MVHVVVHGPNMPVSIGFFFLFATSRALIKASFNSSALTLWQHDNSLTIALDVCKAFLEPFEYLVKLYPGPGAWPRVPSMYAKRKPLQLTLRILL
jgi:hypothetical protein